MSRRPSARALTGIDGEFAARHARLILDGEFTSLLACAVDGDRFFDALLREFPSSMLTVRQIAPGELPPPTNDTFDAVVTLDLLSALPRSQRGAGWMQLDSMAKSQSLICEPLGTSLQLTFLRSLRDLMAARELVPDDALQRMLAAGLPTPEEALAWAQNDSGMDIFFAGNTNCFQSAAERSIAAAGKNRLLGLLIKRAGLDNPGGGATDLEPETVPMRRHRRLYLHRTKG
jgi:hypothetical protein